MDDDDARRALRDSRPGYAADSVRSLLKMAADRDKAKVDMLQDIFLSRVVPQASALDDLFVTTAQLADALGRDDDEREALAEAFRKVDIKGDRAWLRLADAWLRQIGVEV